MEKQSTRKLFMLVIAVVSLFLLCMSAFMLTSCGEEEVAEHTEHTYDSGVVTTAATCTTDGVKTFTCTVCGFNKYETIAATGHKYGSEIVVAATCEAAGSVTQQCEVCLAVKTISTTPALGHDFQVSDKLSTDPTCVAAGTTVRECTRCGLTTSESVAALGHDFTETAGPQSVYVLEADGNLRLITTDDDINSFDPGTLRDVNGKQVLCNSTASNKNVCSRCDVTETVNTKTAWAHTQNLIGKDATCTEDGYYEGGYCVICNAVLTDTTIKALGHTWERVESPVAGTDYNLSTEEGATKAANCVSTGYVTWVCLDCGETKQVETKALGHGWERTATPVVGTDYTIGGANYSQTKAPTCTEKGLEVWVCKYCSGLFEGGTKDVELDPTGHDYHYYDYVAAYGYTNGKTYTEKVGAGEETLAKDFTCLYVQVCQNCYDISRGSHNDNGQKPTCRTSVVCTVCNEILVPTVDHSLVNVNTITAVYDTEKADYVAGTTDAQKALYEAYAKLVATETWLENDVATHKTVGNAVYVCTSCLLASVDETVTWTKGTEVLTTSATYNASVVEGTTVPHDYVTYTLSLDAYDADKNVANWWEAYVLADPDCANGFVRIDICQTEDCETEPTIYINDPADTANYDKDSQSTDPVGFYDKVTPTAHNLVVLAGYQDDVHYVPANCATAPVVVYVCTTCGTKIAVTLDDYVAYTKGETSTYKYVGLDESVFEAADFADGEIVYYIGNDVARHDGEMIACGYHCDKCAGDLDHSIYTFEYYASKYSKYYGDYSIFIYPHADQGLRLTDVDTKIAACQGYTLDGKTRVPIKLLTAGHVFLYKDGKVYQATEIKVYYDNDIELPVEGNTYVGEDGLTYLYVSDSDLFYVEIIEADFVREVTSETVIEAIKAVDPNAFPAVDDSVLVAGDATVEIEANGAVTKTYTNDTEAAVTVTITTTSDNLWLSQITSTGSEGAHDTTYTYTVAAGETLTLEFTAYNYEADTIAYTVTIA